MYTVSVPATRSPHRRAYVYYNLYLNTSECTYVFISVFMDQVIIHELWTGRILQRKPDKCTTKICIWYDIIYMDECRYIT